MMKIKTKLTATLMMSALLTFAFAFAGCESGGSDSSSSSSSSSNSFVGGWKLTSGSSVWYLYVYADGSCRLCDTASESSPHLTGTYSVSGSTLTGNMTNPGVGEAQIVASLSSGTMSLDFIEHWHTPYKHIAYTGAKL